MSSQADSKTDPGGRTDGGEGEGSPSQREEESAVGTGKAALCWWTFRLRLGSWFSSVLPALWRLKQEGHKFKASLGYRQRPVVLGIKQLLMRNTRRVWAYN